MTQAKKKSVKTTKKEEPKLTEEEINQIRESLTQQMIGNAYAPVSHDTLSKSITYVTAGNGLFKVRKTPVAIFKEQIAEIKNENIGLPDMEEGVELAIDKMPFRYLIEALSFYRDINDKDKTEASVLFFYNNKNVELPDIPGIREENKIITYVPEQTNSGTLSDFKDDEYVHWLRENTSILLETHSHNFMDAFFSGTDDANENNNQFYAVWGRVDKEEPAMAFRYVVGNKKPEVHPGVLFDWPIVETKTVTQSMVETKLFGDFDFVEGVNEDEYVEEPVVEKEYEYVKGPFKQIEYPEDWMGQHSKRAVTTYAGYRAGAYNWSKRKAKNSYPTGGSQQLSFDDFEDDYRYPLEEELPFGAYDTYDYYSYYQEAGLQDIEIYPESGQGSHVSPELENKIIDLLELIKSDYPAMYKEFKN